MLSVPQPLAKSVLIPRLTTAASTADAWIHKKILHQGQQIVKSLEDSVLLIKEVTKLIENKTK